MTHMELRSAILATTALVLTGLVMVACGTVPTPAPAGETVMVELDEWNVRPDKATVPAGSITFEARNVGTIPHELVVIKTDLAADSLVVAGSVVDEDASGESMGEIEEDELGPGQSASATFNLTSGQYVLFCNIPAHYQSGMFAALEVR
jgi:uncharacterized cupredoxin-like copper-binding protein